MRQDNPMLINPTLAIYYSYATFIPTRVKPQKNLVCRHIYSESQVMIILDLLDPSGLVNLLSFVKKI